MNDDDLNTELDAMAMSVTIGRLCAMNFLGQADEIVAEVSATSEEDLRLLLLVCIRMLSPYMMKICRDRGLL